MRPLLIGHKANTWWKIRKYLSMGVELVELDVAILGDEAVLYHVGDYEIALARSTGRVKLGARRIVKLEDALAFLDGKAGVVLDLKTPGSVDEVVEAIDRSRFGGVIYVTSKYHRSVLDFVERVPRARGLVTLHEAPLDVVSEVRKAKACGVSINVAYVDECLVEALHREGMVVDVWTVNSTAIARALERMGVDMITTDNPSLLGRLSSSCYPRFSISA